MRPDRWIDLLSAVVLVFACSLTYSKLFETWTFLVPVTGAALGAILIAAYGFVRKFPPWLSVIVSFVVGPIYVSYAVLVDTLFAGVVPSVTSLEELGSGVLNGFGDTLQAALPVQGQSSTHVFVVSMVWFASMISAELILRTGSIVIPTIPPMIVFAIALPLADPLTELSTWIISAAIAGVLIFVLVRSAPELTLQSRSRADELREVREFHSRTLLSGRLTLGIPVILIAAFLGPALSGAIAFGDDDPFDPRDVRDDHISAQQSINPLSQLKAVIERQPTDAFTVSFRSDADAVALGHLRLVTLDQYTGAEWLSSSQFLPTRGSLPEIEHLDGKTVRSIVAEVEITGDIGPWLPTVGEPTSVNVKEVQFDSSSRDVLAGNITEYIVEGVVANPNPEALDAAVPDLSSQYTDLSALDPAPPAEIGELASEITASEHRPIDQLNRIEEHLRSTLVYDPDAPSGHSYRDIVAFLTEGRGGYSEQYATAFALMARSLGFPTRLAIGYNVTQETDDGVVVLEEITNKQYHVWPEVKLDVGWVAFEPTPLNAEATSGPQFDDAGPGTTIAEGDIVGQQNQPSPREEGPSEQTLDTGIDGFAQLIRVGVSILTLSVVGLALIGLIIVILKRRRRTRRRSAEAANDRILGAWAEVHDRLVEAGLYVPGTYTVDEAIHACEDRFGGNTSAPLQALAPHVDHAVFAEFLPNDAVAEQAWTRAEDFEIALAPQLSRARRFYAKIDPRTLRRY
jgi:transglutaminase-like putative cysteine protease